MAIPTGDARYDCIQKYLYSHRFQGQGVIIRFNRAGRYASIIKPFHFRGRRNDEPPFQSQHFRVVLLSFWLNNQLIDLVEFANFSLPCETCTRQVYDPDINRFMVEGRLEKECNHQGPAITKIVVPEFHWFRWFEFFSLTDAEHDATLKHMADAIFYHPTGAGSAVAAAEFRAHALSPPAVESEEQSESVSESEEEESSEASDLSESEEE